MVSLLTPITQCDAGFNSEFSKVGESGSYLVSLISFSTMGDTPLNYLDSTCLSNSDLLKASYETNLRIPISSIVNYFAVQITGFRNSSCSFVSDVNDYTWEAGFGMFSSQMETFTNYVTDINADGENDNTIYFPDNGFGLDSQGIFDTEIPQITCSGGSCHLDQATAFFNTPYYGYDTTRRALNELIGSGQGDQFHNQGWLGINDSSTAFKDIVIYSVLPTNALNGTIINLVDNGVSATTVTWTPGNPAVMDINIETSTATETIANIIAVINAQTAATGLAAARSENSLSTPPAVNVALATRFDNTTTTILNGYLPDPNNNDNQNARNIGQIGKVAQELKGFVGASVKRLFGYANCTAANVNDTFDDGYGRSLELFSTHSTAPTGLGGAAYTFTLQQADDSIVWREIELLCGSQKGRSKSSFTKPDGSSGQTEVFWNTTSSTTAKIRYYSYHASGPDINKQVIYFDQTDANTYKIQQLTVRSNDNGVTYEADWDISFMNKANNQVSNHHTKYNSIAVASLSTTPGAQSTPTSNDMIGGAHTGAPAETGGTTTVSHPLFNATTPWSPAWLHSNIPANLTPFQ
jgi:hypothetical protein